MANHEGLVQPSLLGGLFRRFSVFVQHWFSEQHRVTRQVMVGAILVLALLAFELFNFDTTEFALEDLLGPVSFAGIRWATILAIAFCSIDFAGLARLITPDGDKSTAGGDRFLKPTWLLLAAWLLGGGMNAIMTWWAVSLALIGHDLGNEVLTREQLLRIVPIFVAMLVWVTRILIISSFTMTADQTRVRAASRQRRPLPTSKPKREQPALRPVATPAPVAVAARAAAEPVFVGDPADQPKSDPTNKANGRPVRRPTVPRPPRGARPAPVAVSMKGRNSGERKSMM